MKIPGPPLPENLEIDETKPFFSLDTENEEMDAALTGMGRAGLVGKLTSQDGQREIVLKMPGAEEVVFSSGWNLPPVGAFSANGDLLICVNRLVGEPTRLTAGAVPDPRLGLDLVCRIRNEGKWRKEVKIQREGAALWLINVVARREGSFWVVYSKDKYGLMLSDPEPGDGIYRVAFSKGKFLTPTLARKFKLPPEPQ